MNNSRVLLYSPERRAPEDLLDDVMLVYQDRRELPDVLILVLRPKGQVEVADHIEVHSHGALTDLRVSWRVVELWNVPASELLATGEPGRIPWVPLTKMEGPVSTILGECRRIIDAKAKVEEHDNLLAVTQVLMSLVHNDTALYAILGVEEAMIESPLLNDLIAEKVAERMQKTLLGLLEARFGPVPADLVQRVKEVPNADRLDQLTKQAGTCSDLGAFRRDLGV